MNEETMETDLNTDQVDLTEQTTGITDDSGYVDESRAWINDLPDDIKGAKTWNRFTKGDDTQMVSVPESLLKTHLNQVIVTGKHSRYRQ